MFSLSRKKVAIVGLAVNNTPLIKYLAREGAVVTVLDQKTPEKLESFLKELKDLPLKYHLGPDYLEHLEGQEVIFLSPGVPKNLPPLREAAEKGIKISSELQLFFSLNTSPTIGITGSSGKTTTTSLIGEMLAKVKPVKVGGNIGRPPISFLAELTDETWVVLELSSFQLQNLGFSPHIAVITNITPNHLDVHSSMDEYIEAKAEILRFQSADDIAILNGDNDITRKMGKMAKGKTYYFSRLTESSPGAFLRGDELILSPTTGSEEFLCRRGEIRLLGEHNIENVLAAALAARIAGVPAKTIGEAVREFKGVEHRLELVREIEDVKYYNDSISTTPTRAIAGLLAVPAPVVLIAGGYDKNLPFDDFVKVAAERCRTVILLGKTAEKIRAAFERYKDSIKMPEITQVSDLKEAVITARKAAKPGDAVLLSPACASYDMFRNFEERGRLFKEFVAEL